MAHDLVRQFDAFQDNPWPIIFREMDRAYPGSRFILTIRQPDQWIRSLVRHFGTAETPMRRWIYGVGSPLGNEDAYLRRYDKHNREVREYFAMRPGDLLEFDVARGDEWRKLCPFLGLPVRHGPFPHRNSAVEREARVDVSESAAKGRRS
jgi:hypothetical protein